MLSVRIQDEWLAYDTRFGGKNGMRRSMPKRSGEQSLRAVAPATETCALPCAHIRQLHSYWFQFGV